MRWFASVFQSVLALLGLVGAAWVLAQTAAGPAVPATTPKPPPGTAARPPAALPPPTALPAGPAWSELTRPQQQALQPLAKVWPTLTEIHRRKWIALAQTYPGLTPENQQKMQSRMVEWAALTPREREVARLNFAETRNVNPQDKAANWEAYQALSAEEKRKLAAQAPPKPRGAAIAPKPVPPEKLAVVPVTRHTPQEQRKEVTSKQGPMPNTLLPQPPAPPPPAPQPAVVPASADPEPAPDLVATDPSADNTARPTE